MSESTTDLERIGLDPDVTVFSRMRIGSTSYNETGSDPDLIIRFPTLFSNIVGSVAQWFGALFLRQPA